MAALTEAEWARERAGEAEQEIIAVLRNLMDDLPRGYIVTNCDVNIGRVDLVGGGSCVYIGGVGITVEVAPTSLPPTTAPSTPAP